MRFYPLALFLLSSLTAAPLPAQTTYTWEGGSGAWSDPALWSPDGVPGDGDTALIGSGAPELTLDATVARVEFSGGVLSGDGNLTVTEAFLWTGGELRGRFDDTDALTIAGGALLHITGPATRNLSRNLINEGTIRWDDGVLNLTFTMALENRPGATFELAGSTDFTRSNGTLDFTNDGLLLKTDAGGTNTVARLGYTFGNFTNDGAVEVRGGTLELSTFNGPSGGTGTVEVAADATLRFAGDARYRFRENALLGSGTVEVATDAAEDVNFGEADFDGTVTVSSGALYFYGALGATRVRSLTLEGGTFGSQSAGSGVTVEDDLTWTGGRLGAGGTSTVVIAGRLDVGDGAEKVFNGGLLANEGTVTWAGTDDLHVRDSQAIENRPGAVFDVQSDGDLVRLNGFVNMLNEGLFVKSAGADTTRWDSVFGSFDNDGEVRVESGTLEVDRSPGGADAGMWLVEGGAGLGFLYRRLFGPAASIEGVGVVDFSGLDGFSQYRATVRPGRDAVGTLAVEGAYPEPALEGALEIQLAGLAAGTEHDVLNVTGEAALGGTLRVLLLDSFAPHKGDRFSIVQGASVSGAFDALDLPDGMEAHVETTGATADLVVTTPVANEPGAPDAALPDAFALVAAYPNPFNPRTTLRYDVPEAGRVRLAVYDALGREVARLVDAEQPAGRHEAVFDGAGLASGLYLVRMTAEGGFAQTRRLTLLR